MSRTQVQPLTTRATAELAHRDITARQLHLKTRAATVDTEKRSVEATLSTPERVRVFDFKTFSVIEEILVPRGMERSDQVPLLDNHYRFSLDNILGSVRDIESEDGGIRGRLYLAKDDETADRAWSKIRDGHLTDVSVGYRAVDFVDIKPNTSQEINGQRYKAGDLMLRVTTKWRLAEVSLVPIGADQAAKMRADYELIQQRNSDPGNSANLLTRNKMPKSKNKFKFNAGQRQYLETLGLREEADDIEAEAAFDAMNELQRSYYDKLKTATATSTQTPGEPELIDKARQSEGGVIETATLRSFTAAEPIDEDAIRASEQERMTGLQDIAELAGRGNDIAMIRKATADGTTVRAFAEHLRKLNNDTFDPAVPASAPAGHTVHHDHETKMRAVAAGVLGNTKYHAFNDDMPKAERDQWERAHDEGKEFKGLGLQGICRKALRIEGRPVPDNDEEMIRAAISTGTLTNIFSTNINAVVIGSFETAPDSTIGWVRETENNNFLSHDEIELGKTDRLEKLGAGGTAEDVTRGDSKESYRIARYARKATIDEIDIINERFDKLHEFPKAMGEMAALLRPELIYALLLSNPTLVTDGVAVFHADHNNIDTNALNDANLQSAITKMGNQTQSGVVLNLSPSHLIYATELDWTARIMLKSDQRVHGADTPSGTHNPLASEGLTTVKDARLGAAGVTDPDSGTLQTGSATTWFMVTRPKATLPGILVAYLRGRGKRPRVRKYTLEKGQWGMGWDINHDIGAAITGYQGLYKGNS